jgi:hypothetical protein
MSPRDKSIGQPGEKPVVPVSPHAALCLDRDTTTRVRFQLSLISLGFQPST